MTSSRLWKDREEEFRRHANDENNSLAADWYSITNSWTFRGGSGERSERIFKSLARKAAEGLKGNLGADACKFWLEPPGAIVDGVNVLVMTGGRRF